MTPNKPRKKTRTNAVIGRPVNRAISDGPKTESSSQVGKQGIREPGQRGLEVKYLNHQ